jgi:hypothetical protein
MFGVSCTPTASFCIAVGDDGEALVSSDPTGGPSAWHQFDLAGSETLWTASCPEAGLCVVGTAGGSLMTSTDPAGGAAAWDSFKVPGASLVRDVSCASASLCVAVVAGELLVSTDPTGGAAAWKPVALDARAVSCPSSTFCMAANGPTVWVSTEPWGGSGAWTSIGTGSPPLAELADCASAAFCAEVNISGEFVSSSSPGVGGSWHATDLPAGTGNLWGVSCPTASFCAVSGEGVVFTSSEPTGGPAAWTRESVGLQDNEISCPSSVLCVADSLAGVVVGTPIVIPVTGGASDVAAVPAPVVKILTGPPSETAKQQARFTFKGVDGGTYQCSIDDGPWAACTSGQVISPILPGDHRFRVRETLNGVTGPADSYSWTVDLPKACILKVARARVFAFTHQDRARLVIHYKAYRPAKVAVAYSVTGRKGGSSLGTAASRFKTAGIFRLSEKLDDRDASRLRSATSMTVRFSILQAPRSCSRYYTKRLTIPKKAFGQTVWFQSDSIFAPEAGGRKAA